MQKASVCKINFKNNYIFICLRGFIGDQYVGFKKHMNRKINLLISINQG
jgi:hypothetical protein